MQQMVHGIFMKPTAEAANAGTRSERVVSNQHGQMENRRYFIPTRVPLTQFVFHYTNDYMCTASNTQQFSSTILKWEHGANWQLSLYLTLTLLDISISKYTLGTNIHYTLNDSRNYLAVYLLPAFCQNPIPSLSSFSNLTMRPSPQYFKVSSFSLYHVFFSTVHNSALNCISLLHFCTHPLSSQGYNSLVYTFHHTTFHIQWLILHHIHHLQ